VLYQRPRAALEAIASGLAVAREATTIGA